MIVVSSSNGSFHLNDDYYLLKDGEEMVSLTPEEEALQEQLVILENLLTKTMTDDEETIWDGWCWYEL